MVVTDGKTKARFLHRNVATYEDTAYLYKPAATFLKSTLALLLPPFRQAEIIKAETSG